MFNFLGMLGWSLDDKTDILSREQFIANFALERVVRNPAVFNIEKLTWMNGVYIREMAEDALVEAIGARLDGDLPAAVPRPVDRGVVRGVTPLIRERIKLLSEAAGYCDFFFSDDLQFPREELLGKAYAARADEARAALEKAHTWLSGLGEWTHEALEDALRTLAAEIGAKPGDLFSLVRVAVTGKRVSPPLFETMALLGRERCLSRILAAVQVLA
jgi:glutamyl-tRNA synthetase